jgi:hypothetical protein
MITRTIGIVFCVISFVILILSIVMAVNINAADVSTNIDFDIFEQVHTEWTTPFLTDIVIQDERCGAGFVTMFESTWDGTVDGCETKLHRREPFIETWEDYTMRNTASKTNKPKCTNIEPVDPIVQSNAFGKYVCGKQGSLTFGTVIRPDSSNNCPTGLQKCS